MCIRDSLLAIGHSKLGIIGQLLMENLFITVLAYISSYFLTQMIADKVCAFLINQTTTEAIEVSVGMTMDQIMSVYGLGILIIGICVAIASYTIIRFKPKDILTKID